ncbi:thioredoxin family protein [Spirosoma rhododendri]|nr:thioredoxin family protein [Spirosoma rhododendri]
MLLSLGLCLALTVARSAVPCTDEPAGIKFFTGSWKAVLAEAKRQNKPVFVDIYTTWCGPCKLMAKEAFPNPKVGEKFNTSFVSYQIDAEKGEGIEVAKKYAVDAYPTALYVSASGDLIHRAVGYGGIKGMMEEAEKAVSASKESGSISEMDKQFADGKRDTDFLATYLQKRAKVGMPSPEALDAYLKAVPESDWSSDRNTEIIMGNLTSANAKGYSFLLSRLPSMRMSPAGRPLMMSLQKAVQADFRQAAQQKDETQLEQTIKHNAEFMNAMRPQSEAALKQIADSQRMRFYQQTGNYDKYRPLAVAEATKLMDIPADSVKARNELGLKRFQLQTAMMPDSVKNSAGFKKYAESMKAAETERVAMGLNSLAWAYYQSMPDKKDLAQALSWSAKSLEYKRIPIYLDTYAHLLGKLGRKDEALKTEQEALDKAKAAGEDVADYEKGIAEMK